MILLLYIMLSIRKTPEVFSYSELASKESMLLINGDLKLRWRMLIQVMLWVSTKKLVRSFHTLWMNIKKRMLGWIEDSWTWSFLLIWEKIPHNKGGHFPSCNSQLDSRMFGMVGPMRLWPCYHPKWDMNQLISTKWKSTSWIYSTLRS